MLEHFVALNAKATTDYFEEKANTLQALTDPISKTTAKLLQKQIESPLK